MIVLISGDLSNIERVDSETDRSIEVSAANFFLGVMKSDPGFWMNGNDWGSGPSSACLSPLGAYTDTGPSPAPSWKTLPAAPAGCPSYPFADAGAPQVAPSGQIDPPVGNSVQYMWNASVHHGDPFAADLTVWVKRDAGSPVFEYHAIRYEYPSAILPSPIGTPSGSTPTPPPHSPPPSGNPGPSPTPAHSPRPSPSPTPIGV